MLNDGEDDDQAGQTGLLAVDALVRPARGNFQIPQVMLVGKNLFSGVWQKLAAMV